MICQLLNSKSKVPCAKTIKSKIQWPKTITSKIQWPKTITSKSNGPIGMDLKMIFLKKSSYAQTKMSKNSYCFLGKRTRIRHQSMSCRINIIFKFSIFDFFSLISDDFWKFAYRCFCEQCAKIFLKFEKIGKNDLKVGRRLAIGGDTEAILRQEKKKETLW